MSTPVDVRRAVSSWRADGASVGFVPTMGALHDGHLSLVRIAEGRSDRVVVSIFVNPAQFGPSEDLDTYPRTLDADRAQLESMGCDLLFLPDAETLYPVGHATFVEPAGAAEGLEGACRPGHFRGVATVVTQLFSIVQPDLAVFGRKDAQQLAVVRQLVRDLHLPIEIVAGPTVREEDGLALSSRNRYLGRSERAAATVLSRALFTARDLVGRGERHADRLRAAMRSVLDAEPLARVEYAEVVDAGSFRPIEGRIEGPIVLPMAVAIGATRLIDNLPLDPSDEEAIS